MTSNDGLAPNAEALAQAVKAAGNLRVAVVHADTDHGWSDHRIFLEATILNWLQTLQ